MVEDSIQLSSSASLSQAISRAPCCLLQCHACCKSRAGMCSCMPSLVLVLSPDPPHPAFHVHFRMALMRPKQGWYQFCLYWSVRYACKQCCGVIECARTSPISPPASKILYLPQVWVWGLTCMEVDKANWEVQILDSTSLPDHTSFPLWRRQTFLVPYPPCM